MGLVCTNFGQIEEMNMVELFLVNYAHSDSAEWACYRMTHSLATASAYAKELRKSGYGANVQSVLIDENGKVSI